ncbi:undecaprenyl-phosphate glucose phosphotransferase [Aquimarina rhabdastrellae]
MNSKGGMYTRYITTISYLIDLLIINFIAFLLPLKFEKPWVFYMYITILWIIIAFKNRFYEVYRYTKIIRVVNLIFTQFIFYFLVLYAFIGFFKEPGVSRLKLGEYSLLVFFWVTLIKIIIYYLVIRYRHITKINKRKVILIGKNKKVDQLIKIFKIREDFGYEFKKQFCLERDTEFQDCFDYVINEDIDEIYCSISSLTNSQVIKIIDFADNNLKIVKFLPDNKYIFTKKLKFEYYDYLPILSLREIPLEDNINAFLKRIFDIIFSLLVIITILSWLTPILALIIKLESKGPVFFKQKRNGINYKKFSCYKFRSMAKNEESDKLQATKNDARVTKVGKFIRKTSIDELPQFFNVLFGDMSVVGPRPHMLKHTEIFAEKVNKFMVRHFVKPGITGLAQVSGFRGEIETDKDIVNRVKYDIFYVENWSLLLDLKIIVQTVLNAVKGEDKAY